MFCKSGIDVCTKDLTGRPKYWGTKNGMLLQKANEHNSGAMIYLCEAR
jgi:hypothetical protein